MLSCRSDDLQQADRWVQNFETRCDANTAARVAFNRRLKTRLFSIAEQIFPVRTFLYYESSLPDIYRLDITYPGGPGGWNFPVAR